MADPRLLPSIDEEAGTQLRVQEATTAFGDQFRGRAGAAQHGLEAQASPLAGMEPESARGARAYAGVAACQVEGLEATRRLVLIHVILGARSMPTSADEPTTLTVLLNDTAEAAGLPEAWPDDIRIRIIDQCRATEVTNARKLFVVTSASSLPLVAPCVSAANRANRLQALLVRSDVDPKWVPFMFENARLHVLRNLIVHSSATLPNRVLMAWAHGEQDDIIADATVVGDDLIVRTCAFEVVRIRFDAYPALSRIAAAERAEFEIEEDGLLLHWPRTDVHLDLEAIRTANNPARRAVLRARQLAEAEMFGSAVRALRQEYQLTQSDITRRTGLSERQVRRIEAGDAPGDDALDLLAQAHAMSPNAYVNAVSERMTDNVAELSSAEHVEASSETSINLQGTTTSRELRTKRAKWEVGFEGMATQPPTLSRLAQASAARIPRAEQPPAAAQNSSHLPQVSGRASFRAASSGRQHVHTVPSAAGSGWVNTIAGRVVSRHRTKESAVEKGRTLARGHQAELVVHRANGNIERTESTVSLHRTRRK